MASMRQGLLSLIAGAVAMVGGSLPTAADELQKYKEMLADPFANPGWLYADEGEVIWRTPAGPKNATLEQCDLGLGPGVVDGAYAQMPRYFADAGRVMDADTRIAWCRQELQGIPFEESAKNAYSRRGSKSAMEQLISFVAAKSHEMPIEPPLSHEKEKEAVAIGEALFYRRGAMLDYACSTCHNNSGARIRLQELSNLTVPAEAGPVMASWPTYRVSHESIRTMQHRMWDCHWQMRMPDIAFGSDATIALIAYMTQQSKGTPMASPSLKR
ncbi:MAG: sulfur oxidation c-type cytochrome SoxA [Hyphomicrobiaceae bacterium]